MQNALNARPKDNPKWNIAFSAVSCTQVHKLHKPYRVDVHKVISRAQAVPLSKKRKMAKMVKIATKTLFDGGHLSGRHPKIYNRKQEINNFLTIVSPTAPAGQARHDKSVEHCDNHMGENMKPIHKTSAISFYLINSGFQAFKNRIREELGAISSISLESLIDDASLQSYYRAGESADFVAASIAGPNIDFDDDYADAG